PSLMGPAGGLCGPGTEAPADPDRPAVVEPAPPAGAAAGKRPPLTVGADGPPADTPGAAPAAGANARVSNSTFPPLLHPPAAISALTSRMGNRDDTYRGDRRLGRVARARGHPRPGGVSCPSAAALGAGSSGGVHS